MYMHLCARGDEGEMRRKLKNMTEATVAATKAEVGKRQLNITQYRTAVRNIVDVMIKTQSVGVFFKYVDYRRKALRRKGVK
jgi:hypothetical protein